MSEDTGLNQLRPRVLYTAYHVRDLERSLAFYAGVLGMREAMRFQLPSGEWECVMAFPDAEGKPQGAGIILMWREDRDADYELGDGYSRLVIKVSDVDAAIASIAPHAVPIVVPPSDAGSMRFAICSDPDGYQVEFLQFGVKKG